MTEDVIYELTRILIQENFGNKVKKRYVLTKEDLIRFCIKLMKFIKEVEE